jgi:hypothetical protein
VPKQKEHFWNPLPLQMKHFIPFFFPVPSQELHWKSFVPDPLQWMHSTATAVPAVHTTPVAIAARLIASRRVIFAICISPAAEFGRPERAAASARRTRAYFTQHWIYRDCVTRISNFLMSKNLIAFSNHSEALIIQNLVWGEVATARRS